MVVPLTVLRHRLHTNRYVAARDSTDTVPGNLLVRAAQADGGRLMTGAGGAASLRLSCRMAVHPLPAYTKESHAESAVIVDGDHVRSF